MVMDKLQKALHALDILLDNESVPEHLDKYVIEAHKAVEGAYSELIKFGEQVGEIVEGKKL